ncbi:NCS1 family transporter [Jeotgalibacillus soli]|uniref:Nitrate reductase n=1 Tax=Jeotgalibacillus soli TaxID=889306 RepID=A0A0C2VUT9_9BACL|nr:NCS1 family transporter [Jeotgalibacillus soli]KIL48196.1 nitrate reductase [Jeotgalibacillus soli]
MSKVKSKNHLLEESILPIKNTRRSIGMLGYFMIWTGMVVMIVAYQFGGNAIAAHPLVTSLLVIFFAYFLIGAIMLLSADIGTEHGLSFAVFLRAPFGIYGTHIPVVSRGIVAAIWFGIQTYLGALALNGIFQYLTGFDNWFLWYVIFAIVQIFNTALGIKAVERFADFAAPLLIGISVWMYFYLDGMVVNEGENIWTFVGSMDTSLFVIFMANFTLWTALAVDIPNISRFLKVKTGTKSFVKRNRNIFAAQLIALPIFSTFMAFIGAVAFVATGDWNPITIIQSNQTGFGLIVLLSLVILAQWSTNNAANLIPAALAFVNAGAPRLSYTMGVIIAGLVGTLAMPWLILNNLSTFLGYYGAALSAVAGIMYCDYYLLRRRRLNVPDLYNQDGQFRFMKGFNPAGLIAWVIGGGFAIWFIQFSYLVGLPLGFVLYYILMKSWILKMYPQQEIESNFDDRYLATSVNKEWSYSDEEFYHVDVAADIKDDSLLVKEEGLI